MTKVYPLGVQEYPGSPPPEDDEQAPGDEEQVPGDEEQAPGDEEQAPGDDEQVQRQEEEEGIPGHGKQVQEEKEEVPGDDADDTSDAEPPTSPPPPLEKMDIVAGYDNTGFDSAGVPPPATYNEAMDQEPPEREAFTGLPQIQEEEAREALLGFVAEHCCYGKGAALDLKFTELIHSSAFHYILHTFGEGRSTSWVYVPYRGQHIDGPENGPAPEPWDIEASPADMFEDEVEFIEVPHTASVKPCHNCHATGQVRCPSCHGRGRKTCTSCGGRGYKTKYRDGESYRESCRGCGGDGTRICGKCGGRGMVTCPSCEGHCKLKWYIRLKVVWTNHEDDHIVEKTDLPDELIREVSGKETFREENRRLWPINHFPEPEINTASERLVSDHGSAFPSEKLLMQRHCVRIVPVAQALYHWKDLDSDFFVYGFEKMVYAPNYPQQCCCGCSLL